MGFLLGLPPLCNLPHTLACRGPLSLPSVQKVEALVSGLCHSLPVTGSGSGSGAKCLLPAPPTRCQPQGISGSTNWSGSMAELAQL